MKKFTITCTEEQLRLIADAVEDWHRFLGGQCELQHATQYVRLTEAYHTVQEILRNDVSRFITPDLPHNASYGWSGGNCPNEHQRKAIAMSYGIYRQILHFFALQHPEDTWNTYLGETLTCEEQGPLIQIEEVKDARQE